MGSENLVGGVVSLSLGFFVLYYTYKYFKEGKMREVSIFSRKIYSFKRSPKQAFRITIINSIIGLIGIISGIGLLLVYFHIIK